MSAEAHVFAAPGGATMHTAGAMCPIENGPVSGPMCHSVRVAKHLNRTPQEAPPGGAGGRLRQGTGGGCRPATHEGLAR